MDKDGYHGYYKIERPQQRTWVGLTKNEVETLSYIAEGNTWIAIELAEAKLKEKNNG
jgi:hypothetical protein